MSNQNVVRAAYYLRISTEEQELDNQRGEIIPFIERRGWKLIHPFEDVMSIRAKLTKILKQTPFCGATLDNRLHRSPTFTQFSASAAATSRSKPRFVAPC